MPEQKATQSSSESAELSCSITWTPPHVTSWREREREGEWDSRPQTTPTPVHSIENLR